MKTYPEKLTATGYNHGACLALICTILAKNYEDKCVCAIYMVL